MWDSPQGLDSGASLCRMQGMILLELNFSPARYGLGKLPVSFSSGLHFYLTITTFYCTYFLVCLPKLAGVLFLCSVGVMPSLLPIVVKL